MYRILYHTVVKDRKELHVDVVNEVMRGEGGGQRIALWLLV